MMHGLRIVVVMPAYRAARTLEQCYHAIPHDVVDEILLVDDGSDDETLAVAERLGTRRRCRHRRDAASGLPVRAAAHHGDGCNGRLRRL
jgi:glycosyltransferase involved in cell wall biosynthesis